MKLNIKQSSWSGWDPEYKPVEIENQYDLELNHKYIIKTRTSYYSKDEKLIEHESEIFSFEITEIGLDSIKINTFQVFSGHDGSIINLRSKAHEFTVFIDKSLKLVTPTMDYGDIFILTLINDDTM